jgi:N-acylneuraminate cytidylyltransferase
MVTAFIPLRSGSKSIIDKNIKIFNEKPLCYWALKTCQESKLIDKIIVAIDNENYKTIISSFNFSKVEFYNRQLINAQHSSSTESVIIEYLNLNKLESDSKFVLIQATSPHIKPYEIDDMINMAKSNKCDIISCVRIKRFIWSEDGKPINYNPQQRPRRQNFNGILVENGAVYISSINKILKSKCRISGNIETYEMNKESFIEIDEQEDFFLSELLMKKNN